MNNELQGVESTLRQLKKWIDKRRKKNLECEALEQAVYHLEKYKAILTAALLVERVG